MRIIQPGFVKTNFGGAGFDRADVEDLPDYAASTAGTGRMFGALATSLAEPAEVAEVIWQAANDPSDQLRYRAGHDAAVAMLDTRKEQDDNTFLAGIRQLMDG